MPTHGNKYQCGFPDLYCVHPEYGERWIEVKHRRSFTPYQLFYFPEIRRIWILSGTMSSDYDLLFRPPNLNMSTNHNVYPKHKTPESQDHQEGIRQMEIYEELTAKGYTVMQTYGNAYQKGFPDLYVLRNGKRQWVEVKRLISLTPSQKVTFQIMRACGVPIWIMYDDTSVIDREENYNYYFNMPWKEGTPEDGVVVAKLKTGVFKICTYDNLISHSWSDETNTVIQKDMIEAYIQLETGDA